MGLLPVGHVEFDLTASQHVPSEIVSDDADVAGSGLGAHQLARLVEVLRPQLQRPPARQRDQPLPPRRAQQLEVEPVPQARRASLR